MESQPDLEIQLLGTFRLTYRGQLVRNVLTKRLVSLLAYLLVHRKESIPRQRLAYLFWPDTGDSQARTNLRRLLHQLREAFPRINDYLHSEPTDLSWNHAVPYQLDIAEFEIAAGQASEIPDLQKAMDLYKGDLLPDLYDDWVQSERERLGRVYEDLLLRLAFLEEQQGYYQNAIRTGKRLLQHDPLREETYRFLMRLHAKLGDRTGVRRIYNTCKAVLRREMGVAPDPETEASYQTWSQPVSDQLSKSVQITASSGQKKTNIPAHLDTLIGRSEDVEHVKALVISRRLVTLTGFGGVGKTRLALAAATELQLEYPNGVYWIDLAQLKNPALIPQVFVDVLGVQVDDRSWLVDRLIDFLTGKQILLVVDNCEHMIEGAGHFIEQVLKACYDVHILTTSRISLRIPGESIYQVQPLPVPTLSSQTSDGIELRIESAQQNSSVMLFIDRTRSLLPTFSLNEENQEAVTQICCRLDGIPLALELAAGRIRLLDPKGIAERLNRVFQLLTGGKNSLPRHQTLQATLDWSYALLSEPEQTLFRRLAVFAGSFGLEDAETVAQGEGLLSTEVLEQLAGLIDHSLVAVESVEDGRYYRYHEVTRQYALDKLNQAGELDLFRTKHLKYYCQVANEAYGGLQRQEQLIWLHYLDKENSNIRSAIEWGISSDNPESVTSALWLIGSIDLYWFFRGRFIEGLDWMELAIESALRVKVSKSALERILASAPYYAFYLGDSKKVADYLKSFAVVAKEPELEETHVYLRRQLGMAALLENDLSRAQVEFKEGVLVAKAIQNEWLVCILLNDLGRLAARIGRLDQAYQYHSEQLSIARKTGDRFHLLYSLGFLARTALWTGKLSEASKYLDESLIYGQELNNRHGVSFVLEEKAHLALLENRPLEAQSIWRDSLKTAWETRNRTTVLSILEGLAQTADLLGQQEQAVCILSACQLARLKYRAPSPAVPAKLISACLEKLRQIMGESKFVRAWARGQEMSLEDVILLAGD